ncbi:HNH endonuclease [Candidatus Gracilibacteria bacterium]|nr:HNH endonuclease [Candidatus Gracilibacteria bacterium]NUJ98554.1 HNH endonuclease [Candidatus Gracilibacteria bacterium]
MEKEITKVGALRELLKDNGGIATWEIIYNEIEKYYPKIKDPKDWQAALRGVLYREIYKNENFKKIDEGIFSLLDYDENKLLFTDEKDILDKNTSKEILINIRIGQAEFRKKLVLSLKKCPITGINDTRILNASHIKPWVMSDNKERLDINNGFLLSPTFDKLFDKGIITFDFNKRIIISNSINEYNINLLGISNNQFIKDLPIEGRERYLEYHQNKIFIKS